MRDTQHGLCKCWLNTLLAPCKTPDLRLTAARGVDPENDARIAAAPGDWSPGSEVERVSEGEGSGISCCPLADGPVSLLKIRLQKC